MQSYAAARFQRPNPRAGFPARGISLAGTFRCARRELAITIKNESQSFTLNPTQFTWLKTIAGAFDKYTINYCRAVYRPSVGSNTAGSIIMGIDWDSNTGKAITYDYVSTLTPVCDVPVWQCAEMVLPVNKLMSRKEYFVRGDDKIDDIDKSPGYLCVTCSQKPTGTYGHIWIDYDITFSGTTG